MFKARLCFAQGTASALQSNSESGTLALWTCCLRALQGSHPGLNSMALVCQPGQSFYCPGNNLWFPLLCLLHMFQWDSTQGLSGRADQLQRGWSRSNVHVEINLQTPFISGRMGILWIGWVVKNVSAYLFLEALCRISCALLSIAHG